MAEGQILAGGGRQLRVAKALKCGQVFVNSYSAGGGAELPFVGVKRSGFGRERAWRRCTT